MAGMATNEGVGLGATIRAWRERLSPSAVGLPTGRARRATGLRREELAERAGVSVDYVVRLEQGRATAPSAQVVASLTRALRLTDAERDHLYRMAGLAPPNDERIPDRIPPGVHRVLHRLGDVAVAVFAADWQMIWWNAGWAALLGDPSASPPALRNFARERFPIGSAPVRIAAWPVITRNSDDSDLAIVSDLRRATGRFPHDARLAELIQVLTTGNPTFARLWASGTVAAHREDRKTVEHPEVGPVDVDCDVLTDGDSDFKIVILTAVPGSADEAKLRHLMATDADSTSAPVF
ncbi:helix-turn-helix transcriptional regulator [Streptomyces sp. DASNCL29]|uniref:helix-turn-helix transcriptional regulator n=1 Tax=Streptomyces sp. DASNCL29 TaxID=2583819 RepID=UPI00110F7321|nr:helix-turn-helix transcriptional regulator [Streptomyces sp. DASNCL29]TMU92713.1 helix-turn-helix domain-containing protein [Streptomyces sp. DASNCL29]